MTNKLNAEELLDKYRKGICNAQEKAIVESWHLHELAGKNNLPSAEEITIADQQLRYRLNLPKKADHVRRLWLRISVAASVLLMLGVIGYLFLSKPKAQPGQVALAVAPVTRITEPRRAMLTLSNGRSIALNYMQSGMLARQGNAAIQQNGKGGVVYKADPQAMQQTPVELFNTITTPKGAGYDLVLADGTKVWLNSSSSLSFPAEFKGGHRDVKLTGEAYFEVAKNKEKPFIVEANGTRIQVLGTHFNVGAYPDEQAVVTTLLEGSVKVSKNDKQLIIVPGQQAISRLNTDEITSEKANIDEVMAWRNGYFKFHNEDVKSIFRKVSRWYDIEVEYRGNFSNQRFGGTYSRSKSINELLTYLEKIGNIHFKIEGRRIIVMA